MKKTNKFYLIANYLLSLLFSFAIIVMNNIKFNPNKIPIDFINNFHFNFSFFIKTILLSIPIFLSLYGLNIIISKIQIKTERKINIKKICIINFISIFITGLIHLITYYPGNSMPDTFYIINSPIYTSKQHPIVYNLLISIPYYIFNKLFSNNISFFLISIIQLLIMDLIITFVIGWFYKTFKHKKTTIFLSLYFSLIPIITNYNTTIVKDSVFCVILLLYLPILYSIINSNGEWINNKKNIIYLLLLLIGTTLIRNNGIFMIFVIILVLLLSYRKYYKKWLLVLIITILVSSTTKLVPSEQINLFQEKVAVPLQQLGYLIYTDGSISKEGKEYFNELMPTEEFKSKYNPYYVDYIKWDPNFNGLYLDKNNIEFIKIWFKNLPNNFEDYVKSYMLVSYGTWAPDKFVDQQSRFLGLGKIPSTSNNIFENLQNKNILPKKINNILTSFYETATVYFSGGICLWTLLILSLYIIYKKNYKYLILSVPLFAIWITLMLASPLSVAFRYMSPFAYMLPFIIAITIINCNKKTSRK